MPPKTMDFDRGRGLGKLKIAAEDASLGEWVTPQLSSAKFEKLSSHQNLIFPHRLHQGHVWLFLKQ